ncbi:hypothetical protein [Mycoplasmopsis felifaucium]|uniref:hypothetical protein n=1 Tax=Mycoplasmopsis felifaucium TaxID=35768 RepID=UPI00048992DF|nr:hypothetical protein [Mycoplasmopsis felifaucium]
MNKKRKILNGIILGTTGALISSSVLVATTVKNNRKNSLKVISLNKTELSELILTAKTLFNNHSDNKAILELNNLKQKIEQSERAIQNNKNIAKTHADLTASIQKMNNEIKMQLINNDINEHKKYLQLASYIQNTKNWYSLELEAEPGTLEDTRWSLIRFYLFGANNLNNIEIFNEFLNQKDFYNNIDEGLAWFEKFTIFIKRFL